MVREKLLARETALLATSRRARAVLSPTADRAARGEEWMDGSARNRLTALALNGAAGEDWYP